MSFFISRFSLVAQIFLLFSFTATAQQTTNLDERIEQAQRQLQKTQQHIANERAALAEQLSELEKTVANLRQKSTAIRRAEDEQSLSIRDLEQRLERWKEQHQYQTNIVNQTLQKLGTPYNDIQKLTLSDKLTRLEQHWQQRLTPTPPRWSSGDVLTPDGELTRRDFIQFGPIAFIASAPESSDDTSGLGILSDSGLQQALVYQNARHDELQKFRTTGQAELAIDPTLGKAQNNSSGKQTLIAYLMTGGLWVIPIILAGLVSLAMAVIKAISLYKKPRVNDQAQHPMQQQLLQIINSPLPLEAKEDQLVAKLQWMRFRLLKGLTVIAVVATIAPLLGLLGTVSGMITTFDMMANFGTSDPQVVSGGIGQALITTELGLVVAIPSLVLSAVLTRKARNDTEKLQQFAAEQMQPLEQSRS